MSKAGETIENPATGERVVVRVGTEESEGQLLVSDLYVKPGGQSWESTSTRLSRSRSRWYAGG